VQAEGICWSGLPLVLPTSSHALRTGAWLHALLFSGAKTLVSGWENAIPGCSQAARTWGFGNRQVLLTLTRFHPRFVTFRIPDPSGWESVL
jgi:hypothetical protein